MGVRCACAARVKPGRGWVLGLLLIQAHVAQKPVLRVEVGGVSIRATDKHSEEAVKFPAGETPLKAKLWCSPLLRLLV